MFKLIKFILIFLSALVLLAIVAACTLLLWVDPNNYKTPIITEINKQTGRALAINGNIAWSFFPTLGLQVNNITLADSPQFSSSPMLSIQQADIQIKLLPLLNKNIEVSQIKIDGLKINAITDKMGNSNWLALPTKKNVATVQNKAYSASNNRKTETINLGINNVIVNNAELTWNNQKTAKILTIAPLQINAKHINILKRNFEIDAKFTASQNLPAWRGEFSLKTQIKKNPESTQYHLNKVDLKALLSGALFSNATINANINTEAILDQKTGTLQLIQLKSQINNLSATGKMNVSQLNNTPVFNGELQVAQFDMQEFLKSIGLQLSQATSPALTKVQADLNFSIDQTAVKFSNLRAIVDNSIVNGEIQLTSNQPGFVNLNIDQINLNPYLDLFNTSPPVKMTALVANTVTISSAPIQTSNFLQTLNLTGQVDIGKLKFNRLNIENFHTGINANHAVIELQPTTAQLYGGNYQGRLTIDLSQPLPRMTGTANFTDIHTAPLFKDLGASDSIEGTFQLTTKFMTSGSNRDTLLRSLNGEAKLQMSNGVIKGLNMIQGLQKVYEQIKRKPLPKSLSDSQTTFSNLSATFLITNGIATNNDFSLTSSALSATGEGHINLGTTELQYNLEMKLVDVGVPELILFQQSAGGSLPLVVTGKLGNLRVAPNLPIILTRISGQQLGTDANALGEKLEKASKDIGKQLKSLFGR